MRPGWAGELLLPEIDQVHVLDRVHDLQRPADRRLHGLEPTSTLGFALDRERQCRLSEIEPKEPLIPEDLSSQPLNHA